MAYIKTLLAAIGGVVVTLMAALVAVSFSPLESSKDAAGALLIGLAIGGIAGAILRDVLATKDTP